MMSDHDMDIAVEDALSWRENCGLSALDISRLTITHFGAPYQFTKRDLSKMFVITPKSARAIMCKWEKLGYIELTHDHHRAYKTTQRAINLIRWHLKTDFDI